MCVSYPTTTQALIIALRTKLRKEYARVSGGVCAYMCVHVCVLIGCVYVFERMGMCARGCVCVNVSHCLPYTHVYV